MNKAVWAIFAVLMLDSVGMGVIMPILPALIRDAGHAQPQGWQFGGLLSLYAVMQFLFSPLLGSLSDRYGRRPVLLISLAGAAADFLFMAFAPDLWWLFVGRAISGMTGANAAVASAYIADVTPEDGRARRFGQMGAIFGIGFIIGPMLGGLLGQYWVRLPFVGAAALAALNFLMVLLVVPESRVTPETPVALPGLSLLGPLKPLMEFRALWSLIAAFAVMAFVGEVAGTIWVVHGEDRYAWSPGMIGLSLTLYGVFHAAIQGALAGPLTRWFGNRGALFVSMGCDAAAYLLMGLAGLWWMPFAILPLFALGGVGMPVLQSLLSGRVDSDNQGKLAGMVTSLNSFVSIFGPMLISMSYFATRGSLPGAVWLGAAAAYLICVPLLAGVKDTPMSATQN